MRPDRAVYNALITACIRCGALERAFDILEDMRNEKPPVAADCITAGALLGAPALSPAQVPTLFYAHVMMPGLSLLQIFNVRCTFLTLHFWE